MIAGPYLTVIQAADGTASPGPLLVVNDDGSASADGVPLKNATVSDVLAWSAADGNPSSGNVVFVETSDGIYCNGSYVYGSGPLPEMNLSGGRGDPQETLAFWNGVYNTFIRSGTTWTQGPQLGIGASPGNDYVSYGAQRVASPVYTGVTSPPSLAVGELAWFTTAGNAENVTVAMVISGAEERTFTGAVWNEGTRPAQDNLVGTTSSATTPPAVTAEVTTSVEIFEVTEVLVSEAGIASVGEAAASEGAAGQGSAEAEDAAAAVDLAEQSSASEATRQRRAPQG